MVRNLLESGTLVIAEPIQVSAMEGLGGHPVRLPTRGWKRLCLWLMCLQLQGVCGKGLFRGTQAGFLGASVHFSYSWRLSGQMYIPSQAVPGQGEDGESEQGQTKLETRVLQ